jgi:hypothetical protein
MGTQLISLSPKTLGPDITLLMIKVGLEKSVGIPR